MHEKKEFYLSRFLQIQETLQKVGFNRVVVLGLHNFMVVEFILQSCTCEQTSLFVYCESKFKEIFFKKRKHLQNIYYLSKKNIFIQNKNFIYDPLFESIFFHALNTHAPVTTKKVRANNHQFMTKVLRKAIMISSRFKNAYLKTRNSKNWQNNKKQRNFCTNLLKKTKSETFVI